LRGVLLAVRSCPKAPIDSLTARNHPKDAECFEQIGVGCHPPERRSRIPHWILDTRSHVASRNALHASRSNWSTSCSARICARENQTAKTTTKATSVAVFILQLDTFTLVIGSVRRSSLSPMSSRRQRRRSVPCAQILARCSS
jgi:hypothetical protein